MKSDAIAYGLAGIAFGLIAGWVIGSQQARVVAPAPSATAAPAATSQSAPPPAPLDESRVNELKATADKEPANAAPRVQLANLYVGAERYADAITWFSEALKITPNDPDVSSELGLSYYYTNQTDRALQQFEQSLKMNPKHLKTLLNMGVVKAFGKQDLAGAEAAWQQIVQLAPDTPEGQAAKRGLESLRAAHQQGAPAPRPGA